jgi:hypothetical protein
MSSDVVVSNQASAMSESLSTVCDHCGAKLKLKNPDLEGKRIKCPKCEEAFVVVVDKPKPTAKKPVKKRSSADDDDSDFMDVDPDDYASPMDDGDEFDDDDAPRSRRSRSTRGGRSKSKKKSTRGGDPAQIVKIMAITFAVVAILGGGVFGLVVLLKGDGSSEIDWLPTDVQGYARIQVDDVWSANALQGFKNGQAGQKMVEQMTKNIGIGPQDVDLVTLGFPGKGQQNSAGTMIIHSKKPFNVATIQASEPNVTQVSHAGSSYLKLPGNDAVYFPDANTLIRGPEPSIQAVMSRGKKNPSAAKFAYARGCRDHVVLAVLEPNAINNGPRGGNPFSFASSQSSETMLIRANASTDIRATVQAGYNSPDIAKASADKTKADLDKEKADLARTKTQMQNMPANPLFKKDQVLKLMTGAEQVMNSIQVTQSGSKVYLNLNIYGQLINDFTELASSAPVAGPSMGIPFLFGR